MEIAFYLPKLNTVHSLVFIKQKAIKINSNQRYVKDYKTKWLEDNGNTFSP